VKNIHPLRAARRKAKRVIHPPKPRCIFCLETEHPAGRNHDFALTFPDICQKHHDQVTEARRDADINPEFERNPVRRVAFALKSVSVFLHMLADAMWKWADVIEQSEDPS
jgi:hypothetical protein